MPHPEENLCNENTFNTFYIKYVEDAFNFMFYRCGNRDQSLDLVQEAFIKSIRKPKYWSLFKVLFRGGRLNDSLKHKQNNKE